MDHREFLCHFLFSVLDEFLDNLNNFPPYWLQNLPDFLIKGDSFQKAEPYLMTNPEAAFAWSVDAFAKANRQRYFLSFDRGALKLFIFHEFLSVSHRTAMDGVNPFLQKSSPINDHE